jgi:anti-anti-sigma regulatory factor
MLDDTRINTLRMPAEVTIATAAGLKTTLLDALASGLRCRLDLSAVEEFDLAGLELLLSAHKSAVRAGIGLEVLDSPDRIWSSVLRRAGVPESEWPAEAR